MRLVEKKTLILLAMAALVSGAAAAEHISVDSVWYERYGLVYAGVEEGILAGNEYALVRGGEVIGAFEIIDSRKGYSKGVMKSSAAEAQLREGDSIDLGSRVGPAVEPPRAAPEQPVDAGGQMPFLPFMPAGADGAVVTDYTHLGDMISDGNIKVSGSMSNYGLAFKVNRNLDVALKRTQMQVDFPYDDRENFGINSVNVRYRLSKARVLSDGIVPSVGYLLWEMGAMAPDRRHRINTVYATLDRAGDRTSTFAGFQAAFGDGRFEDRLGVHAGVAYRVVNRMNLFLEYNSLDLLKDGVINERMAPRANLSLAGLGHNTAVSCEGCRDDSLSLGVNFQPRPNIILHAGIYDVADLRSPSAGFTVSF